MQGKMEKWPSRLHHTRQSFTCGLEIQSRFMNHNFFTDSLTPPQTHSDIYFPSLELNSGLPSRCLPETPTSFHFLSSCPQRHLMLSLLQLVYNLKHQPTALGHLPWAPRLWRSSGRWPSAGLLGPAGTQAVAVSSASRGQATIKPEDYGVQHGLRPKDWQRLISQALQRQGV